MTADQDREETPEKNGGTPLCVSVDGALIPTSLASEALFRLIGTDFLTLLKLPFWFLGGRTRVNKEVASRIHLNDAELPYNEPLLEFLRGEHAEGRAIVLVTTAPENLVTPISERLGVPADVIASTPERSIIRQYLGPVLFERFGPKGFDYVGDLRPNDDLRKSAREVLAMGTSERPGLPAILEAMRVDQWLKNILIFLPLLADQSFNEPPRVFAALLAFVVFSLAASGVYLVNDLLDPDADRLHPTKRRRPLASGRLRLSTAPGLVLLLEGTAVGLAAIFLPLGFLGVLAGYLVMTTLYSLRLKGVVLVDVLVLAGLYTLRVVAGAAATGITLSMWLLAFSMFLFLSLALVKRYGELFAVISAGLAEERLPARSYRKDDLPILVSLGTASGYLSVLVLALYIVGGEAAQRYSAFGLIWLLCPLLLYWISRAWIVVGRHQLHGDPLVWAVRDRISRWVALIALVIVFFAQ